MVLTKRKQVHTRNGVCRYLVKYLTKAVYSDDILAILYRKRLWASTMPAQETWSLGYEVVGFAKTENVAAVYEGRHVPHRSDDDAPMVLDRAWELVQLCKGKFARWRISCGVEDIERKIFDDEERERFREWWERRWASARVGPQKNVRTAAGPKVLMGRSTGNATRIDRDAARGRSMERRRKDLQPADVLAEGRWWSDEAREGTGGRTVKELKWKERDRHAVRYALEKVAEAAAAMAYGAMDEQRRCYDENARLERAARAMVYFWIARMLRRKVEKVVSGT
jgi:hypothetical protein